MPPFREVWAVDFEFRADPGERPWPVCVVACELYSGRQIRLWRDELLALRRAPFDTGPDSLFIAYYASAEIGCFLELGWPLPPNILDLYAEHRVETNGKYLPCGNGLIGALANRGLAHIDAGEKDSMRRLIVDQWQWSGDQKRDILSYCAKDVEALAALYPVMAPKIDLPRALIRGRYMKAVAMMERNGIPVDAPLHRKLVEQWGAIKARLIAVVDQGFGVYDGTTFKRDQFEEYLLDNAIAWSRLPSGALALDEGTFDQQARSHPQLRPLYELRATLGKLRLSDIPVGQDERARCLLSPFRAVTGRNQPSSAKFVFGPARWMRGLVRPPPGYALAYIDFASQEIAIAAGLSGDQRMIDGYVRGDPYLAFAVDAGLAPPDATKQSHGLIRERCKTIVLGVNYGMGPESMALRAGISVADARTLLRLHKQTYKKFWRWSEDTVTTALFQGQMQTVFGWRRHVGRDANPRSLMNFPMQANGAEMMRIAAIAAVEGGIEVCAPIHDAFLIAAPIDQIDDAVAAMSEIMSRAGEVVCGGLRVRTDAKVVRAPDRYMDERGEEMWNRVVGLLNGPSHK